MGFAVGFSECFSEDSLLVEDFEAVDAAPAVAPDEDAVLGVELEDDDEEVLGAELAQNGRRAGRSSSSLEDFLRLFRFLQTSTSAL